HDHNYRKTWAYRKKRREERQLYIRLYTASDVNHGTLCDADAKALDLLHHSLSYEDIRSYRAQAGPVIRKQRYLIRKRQAECHKAKTGGTAAADNSAAAGAGITGWVGGWVSSWVTGAPAQGQDTPGGAKEGAELEADDDSAQLSEKQVQELYDAIEFNEDEADHHATDDDLPKETIKLAATAILRSGSLKLKVDRKTRDHTLMGFMFNILKIDLLQRPQNLVADVSIHRFEVVDGTLPNTQYPRMIYVQSDEGDADADSSAPGEDDESVFMAVAEAPGGLSTHISNSGDGGAAEAHGMLGIGRKLKDPFLQVHFEQDPLDSHADSVVNVKVKSLNVVYHPVAVKAIMDYFEPPSSASAESIHALIAAASKSMAGFRDQTRAGLEYALATHKTVDVKVDFDAPVVVVPQDMLDPHSEVLVLDTGYLTIESQLVDSATTERIRQKHDQALSDDEMKELESLMYDHFDMKLHNTQLLVGDDLATCMRVLRSGEADPKIHVVDRIELNLDLGLCILSEPPLHMPKVTVDGNLPSLQVYFSDRKYKAVMGSIDLILEAIPDEDVDLTLQYEVTQAPTAFGAGGLFASSSNSGSTAVLDSMTLTDTASEPGSDPVSGTENNKEGEARTSERDDDDEGEGDEFFESTDHMGESEQAGAVPAGKLQRKTARKTRIDVGKEPDRVTVRVNFSVDNLVGFGWRTHTDGRDDLHIGNLAVTGLAVECINRPYDLFADVTIHQITVEDHLMTGNTRAASKHTTGSNGASPAMSGQQPDNQPVYMLTSDIAQADANGETGKNLVAVKYHRCQADHPEFTTTYESIGQTVDVDISYLDLMVVRKSILTIYDYILKVFLDEEGVQKPTLRRDSDAKSNNNNKQLAKPGAESEPSDNVSSLIREALDTIRVDVRLKGTDFSLCHDDGTPIALLSVTAATIRVLLTQQMLVEATIGNITLADQLDLASSADGSGVPATRQFSHQEQQDPRRLLLYIKGDELADFRYETFDTSSPSYPGHNAAIKLRLGAAHLTFVERPLCELMLFGSRFSAMHGLFEAARQAAAYGTTQLTEEMIGSGNKYHFDVVMSAPVITFPRDGIVPYSGSPGSGSSGGSSSNPLGVDVIVAQPGELTISNEFTTVREAGRDWDVNHISLALRRIGLKSEF
ncbi:Vacuolar protein sorting-associated protein 13, partial [Coemansia sp. RSA 2618]